VKTSHGFGGTTEYDDLFQVNKGYFWINLKEKVIYLKPNKGTRGKKNEIFKGSRKHATPPSPLRYPARPARPPTVVPSKRE